MNKVLGTLAMAFVACTAFAADEVPLNQQHARVSPAWITDGVMYQLWLRGFTPEGTLKAATQKLPAVADAGFTIIYLSPVCLMDADMNKAHWAPRQRKTDNPRNPYRIKDYWKVDPEFGTDEDLRTFIEEAHQLGMRVLMDIVYFHCGPTADIIEEHPDFMKRDKDGNLQYARWGFPPIDFSNPAVHEYFWKNMEYWVQEFDADGYRCDVSDGIPLEFWETARERLEKIKPDVGILAEGTRKADQLKAFDIDYGWCGRYENAAKTRQTWERMHNERPQGGAKFTRFIENHDIAQDEGYNRLDKVWGIPRVNAVLVVMYTLDGVPFLYNGQEFADVSRNSLYAKWPIDWSAAETETGKARLALCRKLSDLRKTEKPLTKGEVVWLDHDQPDAVAAFLRKTDRQTVLSVVNLSGEPVTVSFQSPPGAFAECLTSGAAYDAVGTCKLEPFGYFVGKALK